MGTPIAQLICMGGRQTPLVVRGDNHRSETGDDTTRCPAPGARGKPLFHKIAALLTNNNGLIAERVPDRDAVLRFLRSQGVA